MAYDDPRFGQVTLNSRGPTPCSPRAPLPSFRGILVAAPARVTFARGQSVGRLGAFAAVPLCIYYCLEPARVKPHDNTIEALRLVAKDLATGDVHTGHIIDPDPKAPLPPDVAALAPPDRAALARMAVGGYVNPNLADYLPIPAAPAVYAVHVELEPYTSNTVRIELVEE